MKVEQSAQEQVEKTLKMLEQLSSREIISITGEGNQLYAALTPKGKHIADELLAQR
jgi:predicted transcriptional regulator